LKKELNVQEISYTTDAGDFVTYQVVPNFKLLGPRVGKLMPKVKAAFGAAGGKAMLESLSSSGTATLEVEGESIELTADDVEVRLKANEGWAASQGTEAVVVLATELTPELIRGGLARDLVRLIQDYRKERDLERTDRIVLTVQTDSEDLKQAIEENKEYITSETLTAQLLDSSGGDCVEKEIGELKIQLGIEVASSSAGGA
jgi:isoleucyl-tRNA synthetase